MDTLYPPGPQSVPVSLTRPDSAYKQRAWLAVASLLFFVLVYVVLSGWFVWTAWRGFNEAMTGGDSAVLNFMVAAAAAFFAVFMLKALFFVKRGGASDDIEITAEQQPRLFEFLYRLADEAGAPRPRRVYVSARVNAAVFYDLSILNLLFPSRKNLEIGLALVNVLTLSEMKAVLAHEFGHFAQRSMAIGSWVYIAQQIAEQVVARRDALDRLLRELSHTDIRLAWAGWLLSLVVWSIRSLMDSLLRLVVLAQRALSRQMEFQADRVAVALTGSDELVHALCKLQAADEAWDAACRFATAESQQGRLPHDLFEVQTAIIGKIARIVGDANYGKVPQAPFGQARTHRVFKSGFAQPPQMWSTHPANADREENAKREYLSAPHDARSAWLLFNDADSLRQQVCTHLYGTTEAVAVAAEDTFKALDERYALPQFEPRYRGAYRGRPLTLHSATAAGLYGAMVSPGSLLSTMRQLYTASLADDVARLAELQEELGLLKALHMRIYQATGGRLVYRGREIARRQLPAAIAEVDAELSTVRQRIIDHDRLCRSAHLDAALRAGSGWQDYLKGLIELLHYSEHTLADVQDAHGLLGNVLAVVTADGKVSSSELKRLLLCANQLHAVLQRVHEHKDKLRIDTAVLARLEAVSWSDMIEEFKLGVATDSNINQWMQVIDNWVASYTGALSALFQRTLEQMLATEDMLQRHAADGELLDPAPAPARVPVSYATLLPGSERKRQGKLGWWDRFQVADGMLAGSARLLVAGSIVFAVLGLGGVAVSWATVSVYNGLGRDVEVRIGEKTLQLAAFSAGEISVDLGEAPHIVARDSAGALIEELDPAIGGHAQHYVYNVAGASPLVQWTASYGNASERPPQNLGVQRWLVVNADIYFEEPPASVKTKGGGATRSVVSGIGGEAPDDVLSMVEQEKDRQHVISMHARWDQEGLGHTAAWRKLDAGGAAASP